MRLDFVKHLILCSCHTGLHVTILDIFHDRSTEHYPSVAVRYLSLILNLIYQRIASNLYVFKALFARQPMTN